MIEYLKTIDVHQVDYNVPAIGLGNTLDHYINNLNSKYVLYLQEDWEFERPIDIDEITWTMDQNPYINLIFFNKIRNSGIINKQEQREVDYDGFKCCVYHGWSFFPGIWRLDFVKKHWVKRDLKPEGGFTNQFGNHHKRTDVGYCRKTIGAYIYGRVGEYRYVRHLGNNWRMAEWRLENGQPGGRHSEDMDKPYMAPWVPYPERPVR